MSSLKPKVNIFHVKEDFVFDNFEHKSWLGAETVLLNKYWSDAPVPLERRATARLLWTNAALLARFDCRQHEPLVVSQNPQTDSETENLWERDVCEIFIAPNKDKPEKYFEFEVAPTGEWLDYSILQRSDCRETDTTYNSGIKTAAQVFENSFRIMFEIGWMAFGKKPKAGDEWLGNLFRCVGTGVTRGYLAWQPTLTPQPNFHVPQVFGILKFEK